MDLIDICLHDLATPSKGEIRSDGTVSRLLATGDVDGEATAELQGGVLTPAGLVKFGLPGKELRHDAGLHAGLADLSGIIPVCRLCTLTRHRQPRPRPVCTLAPRRPPRR
jgi:hypothetical protein